jgi:hypothetical protein
MGKWQYIFTNFSSPIGDVSSSLEVLQGNRSAGHLLGGLMGSRAGVGTVTKRRIITPSGNLATDAFSVGIR